MGSSRACLHGFRLFFENGIALPFHDVNVPRSIGRAWKADELRFKSFEDLHKLWYVMLRERNLLSTQYLESRRFGQKWFGWDRLYKVKLGMARIKTVLTERRNIFEEAKELLSQAEPKAEGDIVVNLDRHEKQKVLEGKRKYRQVINYKNKRHPLFT